MEHVLGVTIAAAAGLFASVIGFDKERSFYPVVLFVVARRGVCPLPLTTRPVTSPRYP